MPPIRPASRWKPWYGFSPGPGSGGILPTPTAYYRFQTTADEISPTAAFNTVTNVSGLIGNGESLAGNIAIYTANASKFNPAGTDWTFSYWLKLTNITASIAIYVANGSTSSLIGPWIRLSYVNGTGASIEYSVSGKTGTTVTISTSFSTAGWHLLTAWQTGGQLFLSVDNGTPSSTSLSAITLSSTPYIYALQTTNTVLLDEMPWFKGIALTSAQRTTLYNGGAGHTYINGTGWV